MDLNNLNKEVNMLEEDKLNWEKNPQDLEYSNLDQEERDRMVIYLIHTMGIDHFIGLLTRESKELLEDCLYKSIQEDKEKRNVPIDFDKLLALVSSYVHDKNEETKIKANNLYLQILSRIPKNDSIKISLKNLMGLMD
jgi:hypothetical protein